MFKFPLATEATWTESFTSKPCFIKSTYSFVAQSFKSTGVCTFVIRVFDISIVLKYAISATRKLFPTAIPPAITTAPFETEVAFDEPFDEVEKFLVNRLVRPEYTAVFQVPAQNEYGQTYTDYQQVTWPKDGPWNLDIRSFLFEVTSKLQAKEKFSGDKNSQSNSNKNSREIPEYTVGYPLYPSSV